MPRLALVLAAPVLCASATLGHGGDAIERAPPGIAAFVGTAVRGPLDSPTPVESLRDLLAVFGEPDVSLDSPYLIPAVTAIIGLNGTFVVPVELTYRYSDSLLFNLKYAYLGGAFIFPTGFFRDRSQLSARVTFLLN